MDHEILTGSNTASVFRAMAHFDTINYGAKEHLERHAIQNCDKWQMGDLADIAFSMTKLRAVNGTFMNVVKRRVLTAMETHEDQ